MPKALTAQEKRIKALAKQQEKTGVNAMTTQEASVARDRGFIPEQENNRGEEARFSHGSTPRTDNERPQMERKRGGFAGTSQKLNVTKSIPGYHLHIFNDDGVRVEEAISVGWEFVTPDEVGKTTPHVTSRNTDLGDKVRFLVGKTESGSPLYAYLMKIREEWWLEDQQALQARNDMVDEAIRSGNSPEGSTASKEFYVGKEGIKIKN